MNQVTDIAQSIIKWFDILTNLPSGRVQFSKPDRTYIEGDFCQTSRAVTLNFDCNVLEAC